MLLTKCQFGTVRQSDTDMRGVILEKNDIVIIKKFKVES